LIRISLRFILIQIGSNRRWQVGVAAVRRRGDGGIGPVRRGGATTGWRGGVPGGPAGVEQWRSKANGEGLQRGSPPRHHGGGLLLGTMMAASSSPSLPPLPRSGAAAWPPPPRPWLRVAVATDSAAVDDADVASMTCLHCAA
jgi:hypothetical protein